MTKASLKFFMLFLLKTFLLPDLFSQNHSSLSLSIGTSLPIGSFSSDDTKNRNAGLAKAGAVLNLKYARVIPKEKFGLGVLLRASVNGLNTNALIDSYYDSNPLPQLNWQKKVSGWREFSILPGIIYTILSYKKIQIQSGLYIGAAYTKSPKYSLNGNGSYTNSSGRNLEKDVTFEQDQANAVAFTGALQGGFKYPINKRLSLIMDFEYHYLKPTFKDVRQIGYGQTVIEPGGPSNTSLFHYESQFNIRQNMNTINFTIGLSGNL